MSKKPLNLKFSDDTKLILETRAMIAKIDETAKLCKAMAEIMSSDDFEPLPAFTVEPWKSFDND